MRSLRRASRFDVVFYAPRTTPLLNRAEGPATGGAETQVFLLARALAARGHRVGLVVREAEGELPPEVAGVTIITQPVPRSGPRMLRSVRNAIATLRTLWPLDVAVLVQRAAGRETGLVAVIAKVRRRRFVYSSANIIDFDFDRLEPRRTNVVLFHLGVRLADRVVVQTTEQDELCRRRFKRVPVVIRSLAEPATLRVGAPQAFLWVGRLTDYKRPLAFITLARLLPQAHFWMVCLSGGDKSEQLRREIDEAKRGLRNLEVLTPRPRSELALLIEQAVAMVNTAEYEGMPNVFLEAWSRGVPALALNHDPDGVISREGLGCFADGDPCRFAELAQQLWDGRDHQEDLALRCLHYTTREHAPALIAARWAAVLGLDRPDAEFEGHAYQRTEEGT